MPDNPTSNDELHKMAEQGRKFLEKRRRNAFRYRNKLKEEGIDSTILRIEKVTLDKIRAIAAIEGKTLNKMIVRAIEQGIRWRREILEGYVRGEIPQERAVEILKIRHPSELSKLLALEGLPIPL